MSFTDLVIKCQGGDARAYGQLVERFEGMAFGYAYSLLGDFHLAQDATQEAFLEGYRHVGTIREPRAWPTWLRRIVFKHCDRLRRRKRLITVPLEAGAAVADDALLPDELMEREEMQYRVMAALDVLTEEERAIAILFAVHRYRQSDIGVFLELPLHTIKNRLRNVRKKLSERILDMTKEAIQTESASIHERFSDIQDLGDACRNGDITRVTNLLQRHPEVLDSPDRDTRFTYPASQIWSPLGLAALNGQEALARMLLDMGANPVPYEFAAQYHEDTYTDWLDAVRERGCDVIADTIESAVQGKYGPLVDQSNVHQAVREGDLDRVQTLLHERPERIGQVDLVGNTALHWAVWSDNLEMVRLLLDHDSPIDTLNGSGRTPAVVALFGYHRWWRYEEKPEILELLVKSGASYTLLMASTVGDLPRVEELLHEDPSRANELDSCGRRPLSGAAGKGHAEIIQMLLKCGADPNAKEAISQGGMSLHLAASNGYVEIVRMLLDYGAVPEHWVDSSGDALSAAYSQGHKEILQLLYAHGGTMQLQVYAAEHRIDVIAEVLHLKPTLADEVLPYGWNDDGNEELACDIMRLAIRYGARFENASSWNLRWTLKKYPKLFRILHEHGADANIQLLEIAGDQARRWLDSDHRLRTMTFLVEECGADVNSHDEDGFTVLALAAREGLGDIVNYLLSVGATPDPEVQAWTKPSYLAEKGGYLEIVEALGEGGDSA